MKRLRRLRRDALLSVADLSAATGVPVTTIYNLERGDVTDPRDSTLFPLARHFSVSPDDLLEDLADEPTEAAA